MKLRRPFLFSGSQVPLMKFSAPKTFLVIAFVLGLTAVPAFADTYHTATFSGSLGSSPNIKPPFANVLTPSGTITGTFVYDDTLITTTPLLNNVLFSSFPDIAKIPNATAFQLDLGPRLDGQPDIVLDLGNSVLNSAGIQYSNGQFNGFVGAFDFMFQGTSYELRFQGPTFSVLQGQNGITGTARFVNGSLLVGNANLTNVSSFDPNAPLSTPEPSSVLLVGSGLLGGIGAMRRRFLK